VRDIGPEQVGVDDAAGELRLFHVQADPLERGPVPGLQAGLAVSFGEPARQHVIEDHITGMGQRLEMLLAVGQQHPAAIGNSEIAGLADPGALQIRAGPAQFGIYRERVV
jgi:hypothetical protein